MWNKLVLLALGKRRGAEYLLERKRIHIGRYYDLLTEQVIQRVLYPGAVGIDVGCHAGSILKLMLKYAPGGRFFAFEPIPGLFAGLERRFRSAQVKLYQLALSDRKGHSEFNYVISNPGYSGLRKRKYDRPAEEDCSIEVSTDTLDNILKSEELDRVDLIKIDVEGAEYLVLRGAEQTIRKYQPVIIFEHGFAGCQAYGMNPTDIYEFINRRCDLQIFLLPDWLDGEMALMADQFNDQINGRRNHLFVASRDLNS